MVLISSWEAAARPKVSYPALFRDAVKTTTASLVVTGLLMLLIVMPTPWYNAQYLIPVAGMLIANALNGNALALNGMLDHLTKRKEQVEVLICFGGTKWEASWPGFTHIFRTALIPGINGMNIIGLVSIPGMMTGQVLGGSSPEKAARYQIVITSLISGSNFLSVLIIMLLTISSLFDKRGRLDTAVCTTQGKTGVGKLLAKMLSPSTWKSMCSPSEWKKWRAARTKKDEPLLARVQAPPAALELRAFKPYRGNKDVLLDIKMEAKIAESRPVTVRMELHRNELAVIMGPSGIGKSTILRMMNDLQDPGSATTLSLPENAQMNSNPQEWRRDVLYLHQSKAPLEGKPRDLMGSIEKLKINAGRLSFSSDTKGARNALPELKEILLGFSLSEDFLDRPWLELSGGESQRVMIAIGLATKPRVILLDEPTSALDDASKRLVENAVAKIDCAVIWVTHDEVQAERLGHSVWRLVERGGA
jgi:putative ABC transport system permease protein